MRPNILFPLFADITGLPGIGSKVKALYERIAGTRVVDLLWHFPTSLIDRRSMPAIRDLQTGAIATVLITVEKYVEPPKNKKNLPFKVLGYNETGFLTIVFFHAYSDYIKRQLPIGEQCVVSGKIDGYEGSKQMVHPDYIYSAKDLEKALRIEPVYALTQGLSGKHVLKTMDKIVNNLPILPEWIEPGYMEKKQWKPWHECIKSVHLPQSEHDLLRSSDAQCRLAYDELLASQLALQLIRRQNITSSGKVINGDSKLRNALTESLPFTLTHGQKTVLKDIYNDQNSTARMMRLLQGDVGSGKTAVALFAMIHTVEAGFQACIMAPTEILAKQHMDWISSMCAPIGVRVGMLIGSLKSKEKENVLLSIKNGDVDIIVGTHALFQEHVIFKNLGLVIIDEQHRFGVKQRMSLTDKGQKVDTLVMSATPIPRTLTLTLYGDMECSVLSEKPKGRKNIDTRVMPITKLDEVVSSLARVMQKGEKIYWICPLIENSELSDFAAAEERCKHLKKHYGKKIGLAHGRMKTEEREHVMRNFRDGDIDVLVATTVIEVGVDVPDATVIIIEHAERFGLSQLHQLRGRVGRGNKASSCILLYQNLGETSKNRLMVMRESNDGFRLAEEDLKLRGGGDIMGTKQSGLPQFKVARLDVHFDLVQIARDDAKLILNKDPNLLSERGCALKTLLYLFEYEQQIKYLQH